MLVFDSIDFKFSMINLTCIFYFLLNILVKPRSIAMAAKQNLIYISLNNMIFQLTNCYCLLTDDSELITNQLFHALTDQCKQI